LEPIQPEIKILLTGARGRLDDAARSELPRLIAAGIDWTYLTQQALVHAIANRLFANLLSLKDVAVPEEIAAAATHFLDGERCRSHVYVGELFTIIDALTARGIATIPFKGPLLASLLYDDITARSFRDLDFLLRAGTEQAAFAVLDELGYRVDSGLAAAQRVADCRCAGQDLMMPGNNGTAPIEPHWALCPRTLSVDLDYDGMWRRAIEVPLHGRIVLCFAPEDQLIALALQGAKDEWSRLQGICDIAEFISVTSALAWEDAIDRAREQGVLRILFLALLLARDLMGTALPAMVERALAEDEVALRLAAQARAELFQRTRPVPSIFLLSRFRFLMRERWRDRLRYVLRTVTTPHTIHFKMVRLPPAVFFLYVPLKLGHDYVALPLWLIWKNGRGSRTRPSSK
jgi:hypothetical protein